MRPGALSGGARGTASHSVGRCGVLLPKKSGSFRVGCVTAFGLIRRLGTKGEKFAKIDCIFKKIPLSAAFVFLTPQYSRSAVQRRVPCSAPPTNHASRARMLVAARNRRQGEESAQAFAQRFVRHWGCRLLFPGINVSTTPVVFSCGRTRHFFEMVLSFISKKKNFSGVSVYPCGRR